MIFTIDKNLSNSSGIYSITNSIDGRFIWEVQRISKKDMVVIRLVLKITTMLVNYLDSKE